MDAASEDGEKRDYSFELRKPPTIKEACKALDSLCYELGWVLTTKTQKRVV